MNHRWSVCGIVLLLSLTGCVCIPVSKYDTLSESGLTLHQNSVQTYDRVIRLQRRFAIYKASDDPLKRGSFKPITSTGVSYDLAPELQVREKALDVLAQYLKLLDVVAGRDVEGGVDKASDELAASLKSLSESAKMDQQAAQRTSGSFLVAVNAAGRAITRRARLSALKEAMDSAQPGVESLSELIQRDDGMVKKAVEAMLEPILDHGSVARPKKDTPDRYRFDDEMASIIEDADGIDKSLDGMSATIKKIPAAHREIRLSLDKKGSGRDAIVQMIQEAQKLKKVYQSAK